MATDPSRNKAADRLRDILANATIDSPVKRRLATEDFEAALATERHAIVERIQAWLLTDEAYWDSGTGPLNKSALDAFLEKEAAQ